MSILAEEYNTLQDRQEAIKQDMLGVAAAIEKLDNSLGKKIASEITSKAFNQAGVPIKIPTQLGYFSFGLLGLIPTTIEGNKMRKYKARLQELETEYNTNAMRLQEINDLVKSEESMSKNKNILGSSNTNSKSNTSPVLWAVLAIFSLGLFAFVRKRSVSSNKNQLKQKLT
ncbi:hypothetical protein EMA8858_02324 [Emticicia aquatica]|uniref:LPXTG cell wall anchor domain-containing protein n=1 Tax=Emticicia aquatica TaxID=1681835 RepID=A0ABN8ET45_9BACT|nr:hypothetical protein [Emticicia aquatica]CAH0996194.1 hypothetical protein EMA8858_02324 [Emticicia aquatica]